MRGNEGMGKGRKVVRRCVFCAFEETLCVLGIDLCNGVFFFLFLEGGGPGGFSKGEGREGKEEEMRWMFGYV